jgi:hypothetical protein
MAITLNLKTLPCLGVAFFFLGASTTTADDRRGQRNDSRTVFAVNAANELITFREDKPGEIRSRMPITNLRAGETILGIDFRPANGWLYGLGSSNQLYLINDQSGVASRIGAQFTTALQGTSFGFDFNPVMDRIRIVSNTGQNLRAHPDLGEIVGVDGPLAYATGDENAGKTPQVTGAAYTNPDTDANTPTTLYDIESFADFLVIQNPPNAGTLGSVGFLFIDAGDLVGFDIGTPFHSRRSGQNFADQGGSLAAVQPSGGGGARLYQIDLSTGRALDRGPIGTNEDVRGLAIDLNGKH